MPFGPTSESKERVLERAASVEGAAATSPTSSVAEPKTPAKGHGRNGADASSGAARVVVAHESMRTGDS